MMLGFCEKVAVGGGGGGEFTLLDAPSPRGGSCRYISRFAS